MAKIVKAKTIELNADLISNICFVDWAYATRYKDLVEIILLTKSHGYEQPHVLMPLKTAEKLRDAITEAIEK